MRLRFFEQTTLTPLQMFLLISSVLAGGAVTIYNFSASPVGISFFSDGHLLGTLMLLATLPAYLYAAYLYLFGITKQLARQLGEFSQPAVAQALAQRAVHMHKSGWLLVLAGMVFGAVQNLYIIDRWFRGDANTGLDLWVWLGNTLLWGSIGFFFGWRIPITLAITRFARAMQIDVYHPQPARQLANLVTKDVLIIAGAMAFMPLQSLDAQFRLDNYQAGVLVGLSAALVLTLPPILALRQAISRAQTQRLAQLEAALNDTARDNWSRLETLTAHRDRLLNQTSWPFDSGLTLKVIGYSIIAPSAWVGAALVENLVDAFTS